MPKFWNRPTGGGSPMAETKSASVMVALRDLAEPDWTARSFPALAQQGYMRNPVVYRCVNLVAEAAASVPLLVRVGTDSREDHPLTRLLARPNPYQSGTELIEAAYAYLLTAGNAYLRAAIGDNDVAGLYGLRPDRVSALVGRDGYVDAYEYRAGGQVERLRLDARPVANVVHIALFHPLDDHHGFAPLAAAQQSLDLHNAAAKWNKALLDNSARPSGALVYSAGNGSLTPQQFNRLKDELELAFQGAANAGRPMVLEGGLDWKSIALNPKDMDFIEAKNAAAREIALCFGVPPMLLGIPGDNTYANLAEANKALWRQTIVPLVRRLARDLENRLAPAFDDRPRIVPDLDGVGALAEDRAALWGRIGGAAFLSDDEKRTMLGLGARHG